MDFTVKLVLAVLIGSLAGFVCRLAVDPLARKGFFHWVREKFNIR